MPEQVAETASLIYGDTYRVKSIPCGKPESQEAVEITTCSDVKKRFAKGSLKVNGEISVVIAGNVRPQINVVKNLKIDVGGSTVDCGDAICKSAEPVSIESGPAREVTWTCVFQPTGS